jgi:predicted Fe-S protein YdhL (DUF1289 family)
MTAAPIPSPCTSVCRMDERSGHCEGCLRTIDEIAAWSTMSDMAKRGVWKLLGTRRAQRSMWSEQPSSKASGP